MKKSICLLLCTGLLAGLLTGCGGEYAGRTEGDVVSGGAVSGQAVSGGAVSDPVVSGPAVTEEETSEHSINEEYLFCTDTNLYRESDRGNGDAIIQTRLDGSYEKKIKMGKDFVQLICIRDGYLYYFTDQFEEEKQGSLTASYTSGSTIWRVPVKKDKNGYDIIKMEQKEKVLEDQEIDLGQIYINDRYIFYKVNLDASFVKYDREKKKKLPVDEVSIDGSCEEIVGIGNTIVLFADKGAYIHKLSGTGWEQVPVAGIGWESLRAYGETSFFFSDIATESFFDGMGGNLDHVSRYDVITGKTEEIVSGEKLRQAVAGAEGLPDAGALDVCFLIDLFCQGTRCYMQVQANWMDGETYRMEYLMFSCAGEEGPPQEGLRYEKELTECLRVYGTAQEGKWVGDGIYSDSSEYEVLKEHVTAADSCCYDMAGGKAFFYLFDYKQNRAGVGCFDLSGKKFRWLTKKDKEFYEPCYGTWGDNIKDICSNYEMPKTSLSKRSAVMSYGPSEDLGGESGEFVRK